MSRLKGIRRFSSWLAAGAIFVLSSFIFARAIECEFVNYDDDVYVYANPSVSHGLTLSAVVRAFTQPHARNWHPLTTISHILDCQFFGLKPAGHHAVNVLLHAFSAVGLILILHEMTGRLGRALFVAAVFAIHPLRLESVVWIAERKDVLSALFFVLTLGAYVRYARTSSWRKMVPVVLLFAAGLMSKPMLVTLPVVLLLLDFWPLDRFNPEKGRETVFRKTSFWNAIVEKVPLFTLSLFSSVATIVAAYRGGDFLGVAPLQERLGNAAVSCCVYVYQLFWPANLSVFYPVPADGLPFMSVVVAVVAIVAATAAVIVLQRRCPYLFVGWLWYLVMLLPVSGILPIGLQTHADRYTYLPQIGLLIALTWGIADLLRKLSLSSVALPTACVVLALFGWRSWEGLNWWRSSESLWTHALAVTRDNDVALNNLGTVYEAQDHPELALEQYRRAERILDRRPAARFALSRALVHTNLGNVAIRRGDVSAAMKEYRQAIALQPRLGSAHVNLGQAYSTVGDWNSALAEFETAAGLQSQDADVQYRAGTALMQLGRLDEAIDRYHAALMIEPRLAIAELNLGNALLEKGQIGEATSHYRRATQIEPENVNAHFNLASVFLRQRRISDAIGEYQRAIEIQPGDAEAHLNLANAFAAASQERQAVSEIQKALELAPDSPSALNNLAWLLAVSHDANVRDPARAVTLAERAARMASQPNAIIYHTLAAAYAAAGQPDQAIGAAERCKQLADKNGDHALATAVESELDAYRHSARR